MPPFKIYIVTVSMLRDHDHNTTVHIALLHTTLHYPTRHEEACIPKGAIEDDDLINSATSCGTTSSGEALYCAPIGEY